MLLRTLALLAGILSFFPSSALFAATLSLEGATEREAAAARASLTKVQAFYAEHEMKVAPPSLRIVFADEVFLPSLDASGNKISVHGYFDTDTQAIHLVHFNATSQKQRRPWDFPWTDPMAESFLLHELVHFVNIAYMGADFRRLPPHWQEFVAYAVQFELMDAGLREKIVTYSDARAWESPEALNPDFYYMAPELFALKSHLSLRKWGGGAFLKKLIDGQVPLGKTGAKQ